MEDVEVQWRIIKALNESWDNCTPERLSAILLVAARLASQFQFTLVLEPGKGFKKG